MQVAILPDGGEYFGPMEAGRFQGKGRLYWSNGKRYTGEFDDGLFNGQGQLNRADGTSYDGNFKHGLFDGEGRLVYSDQHYYEGTFSAGKMHGKGKLYKDDLEYSGEFSDNAFHGQGKWKRAGDNYIGQFRDGQFDGEGLYVKADGSLYEGTFIAGEISNGIYRDDIGAYEGAFSDWMFAGEGVYRLNYDGVYKGVFVDGQLNGEGSYRGQDGSHYQGEFVDGYYQGKGVLVTAAGDRYEGGFEYGYYHGQGHLQLAESDADTAETEANDITGQWEYGELVSDAASGAAVYLSALAKQETLLYNQSDLLQAAMDQIQLNDPALPELYLLAIAGDGQENVFENEVTLVKDYFDRELDTRGKSILLVNSKRSIDRYPLATRHSIESSLQALGEKMDAENDILFIFMTSHGSQNHHFSLEHEALSFGNLSAEKLARLLQNTPVKWKVIVVSACYSGGFIPPLADEHTLVITAAADDKTSFGCGDTTEYTYFGEAYFKDALPASASFVEAFDKAVAIVSERESEQDYMPSEPQIHKPVAVLEQLARWRQTLPAAGTPVTTPVTVSEID